ncbi:hypothetical protein IAI10_21135 [Clostridium sp. 19966]|uniref:hypothetical protein n=1 Tax=Clostridium sp. 19966 TaxID=2768166 RepID=UPI0028DE5FCF|nr:hypothetical protein [Clostridium sp. 19966]MDT8719159.1 hypothetical protein [Clostridium sp. 19966]
MGYNAIDLINRAIDIAARKKNIYINIGKRKSDIQSIEIVSTVLIRQIDNTIKYYETLKNQLTNENLEDIDFGIYDKISFLINEFNSRLYEPQINNTRDFLKFLLASEKETYSLLVDIQGRFVKSFSDIDTKTYKMLTNVINNKTSFISTLEKLLK